MDYYIYALVFAGIIGLCVGSFLNVVIYRVPNEMNIAKPASHCPKCNYVLKWYDNIPVLSYLMLGGKCRKCKEHISFRYTIVEIINALLWILSVVMFWEKSIFYSVIVCLVCSVLICIFFVDLEHMIIPDSFQVALLILAILSCFVSIDGVDNWKAKLIGMIFTGCIFLLLHCGCKVILKKDGLGGGDVKLMIVCGLLLGTANSILVLFIASISACLLLLFIKRVKGYEKYKEYPFAPFLTVGILIALFFGTQIISSYLSLLS